MDVRRAAQDRVSVAAPYAARMRPDASVLHLDLDAFFAAVEQRDKPSLRGKPVVVGGVGGRGVVSTASYEARKYGVRSAMSTREARSRCPHAAFLSGRFPAYREASERVMETLRAVSPLVEPLSLDEAFVDLARADLPDLTVPTVTRAAEELRAAVAEVTGGLTASVGIGSSKFIAKVASEIDKPDGLVVVSPGTERDLLRPMHVTVIPGVGPATAERLRRAGIHTVADLETVSENELVRLLGNAHGHGLFLLARAEDDRPVVPERETKSVSVEGTYDTDLTDRRLMEGLLTRQADAVGKRLRAHAPVGPDDHPQAAPPRLHHAQPVGDPAVPDRPRRDDRAAGPGAARRRRHLGRRPAARRRASPASPTGCRRTSSATARTTTSREPTCPTCRRRASAPGRRAPTSSTRPRARLGLGLRPGRGHRALRDAREPRGPGALLRRRRPGAEPGTAAGSHARAGTTRCDVTST